MPAAMPRIEQNNWIPILGSVTVGRNDIDTTPIQVLDADPSRRSVIIHNPNYVDGGTGSANLLASQNDDVLWTLPGGGFVIFAGDSKYFEGDAAQGPWYVASDVAGPWGLTIVTSTK